MQYDIIEIDRSAKNADAQLKPKEKEGWELYERNARHYLLRRPTTAAPIAAETEPAAAGEPVEEKPTRKRT